jgi:hypothetical protein
MNYIAYCSVALKTSFRITGDIEQLAPIGQEKLDPKHPANAALFGTMENMTQPDTNHRMDDRLLKITRGLRRKDHFDMNEVPPSPHECVQQIQHTDDPIGLGIDRHLAYLHATCQYINEQIMERRGYCFDLDSDTVSSGVLLVCKREPRKKDERAKYPITKNVVYRVEADGKTLQELSDKPVPTIERPHLKYFEVGFATTVDTCIGLTLAEDERVCVWNKAHLLRDSFRDKLNTVLTRCRKYEQLYITDTVGKSAKLYNTGTYKDDVFKPDDRLRVVS